jgi:hypothetical protein
MPTSEFVVKIHDEQEPKQSNLHENSPKNVWSQTVPPQLLIQWKIFHWA